ncbi:MAG: hypothetical protein DRN04_10020 [Thermoprotei archaeon]|nr:MAG: hypothetical protein DRN04_10020 [Thermoprotei archaeon]
MSILITSSRRPNPRLRTFCKDLAKVLPDAIKVNRGKMSIEEVAIKAYQLEIDHVIVVGKGRGGNPGRMIFLKIYEDKYEILPLIIGIEGVVLIREIKNADVPEKVASTIIASNTDQLPDLLSDALGLSSIEVESIEDLQGTADTIMWIEKVKRKYIIRFFNGQNLRLSGPIIKVNKVVRKCPIIPP